MQNKVFRPFVLVLLLALLGLQVIQIIPPAVEEISRECQLSAKLLELALSITPPDVSEYTTAVYTEADNINQQIFRANEFQFFTLKLIAEQNAAFIEWRVACGN